ncbi:MAG: PEP-utilizing enzyme [Planctomycetota bacterium]
MRWRPLGEFRDEGVGKIFRLRRAARRGVSVPATVWARAKDLSGRDVPPPAGMEAPWIVRSAAPDEDGKEGTAAGRYESVEVEERDGFSAAVARVVASMERAGGEGAAVFVQPLLRPEAAGVAFYDGFFYERSEAAGGNRGVTDGSQRGDVVRGDHVRGEAWSEWLRRVHALFRGELRDGGALDVEYARDGNRYTLLQARPARFPVRRNPILSLANHREILGDHPSPWIVDALVRAGRGALGEFIRIDPEVGRWDGQYAEACAGRAWLSFSFFFRLMDHWGLPRTFVTEGVGGDPGSAQDARARPWTMVRRSPRLVRLQLQNRRTIRRIPRDLAAFDERLDGAQTLAEWFDATVFGLDLALRSNFAINGAWTGVARVRRFLGVKGRACVVTEEMMASYEGLARIPMEERPAGLEGWLERFGHRGPLESDPMQPRFRELKETLLADLLGRPLGGVENLAARSAAGSRTGWFFRIDETREQFRDDLMRRWERLRCGILKAAAHAVEAGQLRVAEDVFLLDGEALAKTGDWAASVEEANARRLIEATFRPPLTARRNTIESAAEEYDESADLDPLAHTPPANMRGIGVGTGVVRGRVHRATDLTGCLRWLASEEARATGADEPIVLLVPALEPSWSVVFGRVGAVVTEIGGELSHASILLRESGTPAVVNCPAALRALQSGEFVEVDASVGRVRRVE